MNPKQIACIILLMVIGAMTYTAQIIHKTVATTRAAAEDAESARHPPDWRSCEGG